MSEVVKIRMRHARDQHAVGQGFFHTGLLQVPGAQFHYVYDCGSMQVRRVHDAVDAHLDKSTPPALDVLFLSHLHEDHVSGLDHLLGRLRVESVFLPLLSPEAKLSCVVSAVREGRDTFNRVEFISDPGRWLRARGVRQVYFVAGDEEADGGVNPGEPSPPPPADQQPEEEAGALSLDLKRLERYRRDRVESPLARNSSGARARGMVNREDRVISHVAPVHVVGASTGILDWTFICYVYPNEELESRLRRELRRRFGGPPLNPIAFRDWIVERLRDRSKRVELSDCVEGCGVRQNFMSMSLYSGPTSKYRPAISLYHCDNRSRLLEDDRCGWLGTGDAELATRNAWRRFTDHYRQVLPKVHTLTVPHHGSQRNFNPDLLRMGAHDYVVASRTNNEHHPSRLVRRQLRSAGRFHHVSERVPSHFAQEFFRHA